MVVDCDPQPQTKGNNIMPAATTGIDHFGERRRHLFQLRFVLAVLSSSCGQARSPSKRMSENDVKTD